MSLSTIFGGAAVVLGAVTGVLGIVAWYLSWGEAGAKDAELQRFKAEATQRLAALNTDLAKARAAEARAEAQLASLRRANTHRSNLLDESGFKDALKGKTTGEAVILYEADDMESYQFALAFDILLTECGWNVRSRPRPIPAVPGSEELPPDVPRRLLVTGSSAPLVLLAKNVDVEQILKGDATGPIQALYSALCVAKIAADLRADPSVPDNTVMIVVWKRL